LIINGRVALATIARALPLVLFRAGVFVAGGFMVIIFFGMLLFASRIAGGAGPVVIIVVPVLAILGGWICGRVLQRFFLFRHRAAMLFLFSGRAPIPVGLTGAIEESKRLIPDHSCWVLLNRGLRQALFAFIRGNRVLPAPPAADRPWVLTQIMDLLAMRPLSQAVLALAYARGSMDAGQAVREALALYFRHGLESRRQARMWLLFSAAGQFFQFLCLAVPNWIFFRGAGIPVWIGVVLAAVIARLLHRAFVVPLELAGLSTALLAETRGRVPDLESCEKLAALFPDAALANKF